MKKIALTGASGFVGYHVAKKLVEKKWGEIFCLTRKTSDTRFLKQLPVQLKTGDLLDKQSLDSFLDGAEILFHVAADYRLWAPSKNEIIEHNVRSTENILEVAQMKGISKIVVTSSVAAVGRPEPEVSVQGYETLPRDQRSEWEMRFSGQETMDPTPTQRIGPYKKSKFLAECVARRFLEEGLPIVIVNPSAPVGPYDIKPTPTGKLILDFLNRKIPAYLDTGLNLVGVEDVAEGHLLAAERGKVGERYILGNQNLMLKEILEMLSQWTQIPAPRLKIPYPIAYLAGFLSTSLARWTGNPPSIPVDGVRMAREIMFYDSSKARQELGYSPRPIDESLQREIQFFKEFGYVRVSG